MNINIATDSSLFSKSREINNSFPETEQLKAYKPGGDKIFGWRCTYIPEELVHAACSLSEGNAYLSRVSCSFSRSCFEMGLRGQYRIQDGIIAGSTCDGARRLCDHWVRDIQTTFTQISPCH